MYHYCHYLTILSGVAYFKTLPIQRDPVNVLVPKSDILEDLRRTALEIHMLRYVFPLSHSLCSDKTFAGLTRDPAQRHP